MSESGTVWVLDDDKSIRWVLEKALAKEGLQVLGFEHPEKLLRQLKSAAPDVIISDVRMPGLDGISLLEQLKDQAPELPVIVMTAYSDLERAVAAFKAGAFEYLSKPFDIDEVLQLVTRAIQQAKESGALVSAGSRPRITDIIGSAPAMQQVFRAIGRLSRSKLTVLVTGESGTGKELVARALHKHSPRFGRPFIALNTAAIPRDLLESELFGHEKAAFTGANTRRIGRFEQADGGSLFLDEIGDMPAELQTRLLRVLAEGEFYRIGGHVPIKVDVRVIAATHQELEEKVRQDKFREDLFHRLNVIRVHVPPLRERRGDIAMLTEYFLQQVAKELDIEVKQVLQETQAHLDQLAWPGNVRQLENFCRWITVMASGKSIHLSDLPPELRPSAADSIHDDWESLLRRWVGSSLRSGAHELLSEALPKFERIMIEEALKEAGGRRQDAAALLGWGRNTLSRKIKALGLKI